MTLLSLRSRNACNCPTVSSFLPIILPLCRLMSLGPTTLKLLQCSKNVVTKWQVMRLNLFSFFKPEYYLVLLELHVYGTVFLFRSGILNQLSGHCFSISSLVFFCTLSLLLYYVLVTWCTVWKNFCITREQIGKRIDGIHSKCSNFIKI